MGEKSDAKLMYSIDGKSFQELPEITELTMDAQEDERQYFIDGIKCGTGTFLCNINLLVLLGICLDKEILTRYCQSTKSNNWLKMHGIPMRRKKR